MHKKLCKLIPIFIIVACLFVSLTKFSINADEETTLERTINDQTSEIVEETQEEEVQEEEEIPEEDIEDISDEESTEEESQQEEEDTSIPSPVEEDIVAEEPVLEEEAPQIGTVIFKDSTGNVLSSVEYYYGDLVETPDIPMKASTFKWEYAFDGWKKGNAIYTDIPKVYEEKAVYVADYKPVATILFLDSDGTVISEKMYMEGERIVAPKVQDKHDLYFAGWDSKVDSVCKGNKVYMATYSTEPSVEPTLENTNVSVNTSLTKEILPVVTVNKDTKDPVSTIITNIPEAVDQWKEIVKEEVTPQGGRDATNQSKTISILYFVVAGFALCLMLITMACKKREKK